MLTTYGGKEETTKAKAKAKATTKEAKAKASTEAKDTTRDSTKATKEATTKQGTTRAKEKATQDPKDMDQARATMAKEATAKQKEKEATTTRHATDVASLAIPQDVNDAWDWYYDREEGQREISFMEENWNDYDYDSSWDWNDSSYEDTANYIGGISESHLTIGHIRQASHYYTSTNPNHYLARKQHTHTSWNDHSKSFQQFLQEDTTQLHFNIAAATHNSKGTRRLRTPSHTTSCTPTSSHTTTC